MDIWEINKMILLIVFVIPGFISIKIYSLLIPSQTIDSSKQVIDAITYSSINYALLIPFIYFVETHELIKFSIICYLGFYSFVLLISPVILAFMWRKLRESKFLQKKIPHPTLKPWDHVFSKQNSYWIIVTLSNGDKIAGKYDHHSFSSSVLSEEQIYLEETWLLNNDGFDRAQEQTAGVIVLSKNIDYVELFNINSRPNTCEGASMYKRYMAKVSDNDVILKHFREYGVPEKPFSQIQLTEQINKHLEDHTLPHKVKDIKSQLDALCVCFTNASIKKKQGTYKKDCVRPTIYDIQKPQGLQLNISIMSEKKGYQPAKKPTTQKPIGDRIKGGYKPEKGQHPANPPKKI